MNPELVAAKLSGVAETIKDSKGPLELFGLFLRDDSRGLWDVIVAAPWLKADERESFESIVSQLRAVMTDEELTGVSQIVILDHGGTVLESFLERFGGHSGLVDVHFVLRSGAIIQQAYIILAHPIADEGRRQKTKKPRQPKRS
jgi:hypothetical protein